MVDRVGAPYRVLLYQPSIRFSLGTNSKVSSLQHPGSGTIFFGNPAWTFLLIVAAAVAGATDISVSVCLYSSIEASSLICKDPSCSDNASILFVLLELVLSSRSFHYTCFTSRQVTLSRFVCRFVLLHLSCKVSSSMLYQM